MAMPIAASLAGAPRPVAGSMKASALRSAARPAPRQVRANVAAGEPKAAARKPTTVNLGDEVEDAKQGGGYTNTSPELRRIKVVNPKGRKVVKVVYTVLEAQYQSALDEAVRNLNGTNEDVCIEIVGYLLEELRDSKNMETFRADVAEANVFIGSLIFIEDLAEKIVEVVGPQRDRLDACVILPSMPAVMKLNKLGGFNMAQLGQSKSLMSDFMKSARENTDNFEENLLALVRTLPKVLKFLPAEKAKDARNFVLSLQYWTGGDAQNLENLLLNVSRAYVPGLSSLPEVDEPKVYPETGIWHPMAPALYEDVREYRAWYDSRKDVQLPADAPTVGLILQRSHIVTGDEAHYAGVIQQFEAKGARVIPVFAGGLDFSNPVKKFFYGPSGNTASIDVCVSLTGFALVGGPARQDAPKAIEALKKLDVPYLCAVPLVFQTTPEWQVSSLGVHPVQVALQVALPELDGAVEPLVFAGREPRSGKSHALPDRAEALVGRAISWANLGRKKNAEKKLAIAVFSFPPDKGNVGTAAYLNVFGSIFAVLKDLKKRGYDVGQLPADERALIESVLNAEEAQFNSEELNIAYKMPVDEYQRLCPYAEALEENWGPPPGTLNTNGQELLVYGKQFGNIFIGVQPTFGYEGDPMRLLFSKSASPHHGFAAFYTYLEHVWGADAVLHFGTHGSLEFMPGKQVGMSGGCYPDSLIGTLPNLYYYAANNPSEATIAKRRSYASTISYLTPPAENAGLYKGLKELKELIASYQGLKDGGRATPIVASIVATAYECNLDRDCNLPSLEDTCEDLTEDERNLIVGQVYRKLMEIESRLLPCGLHVVGVPPTAEEGVATLVNIAEIDRPENKPPIQGIPSILARSIGRNIEEIYAGNNKGDLDCVQLNQDIVAASRAMVGAFVAGSTGPDGRLGTNVMAQLGKAFGLSEDPWLKGLNGTQFKSVDRLALKETFKYLEYCLEQIVKDNEVGALAEALDGTYVEPGPGGDPIRNPLVLPTGKNIHALDPQSIPTTAACKSAAVITERLIQRQYEEAGNVYPETIALVLWGTDNIKTYGESLAQVLFMVGVRPVPDALGRVNKLEVIPLEELGRPRIDVVVNCSGVFRDLFVNQMNLLDRGVKMVAELDEPLEMNYVRKHALEQAAELNVSVRDAATRIFSNAGGSYSSNVNLAVENSSWTDESQLQEMYLKRKSFAFNSDRPGDGGQESRDIFEKSMATVDMTFQNLDSSEISLTDVSHYFDSDPTNLVQGLRKDGKKPASFIADTTTANAQVRSLAETVRLDSRTKLLNPKWYEGMLGSGYEGVREIQKRLTNTMGWSATSGQVDNFVYDEASATFIEDPAMADRLMDLNPSSFRKLVATFLEANGRGYWDATDEQLERLKQMYQDVEDKIEGVE